MTTLEIPRPEWTQFFKEFTALHGGWRCTIEILGDALGAQVQSSGMPLTGIDADLSREPRIRVALGEAPDAHLTHVIDAPEHVWLMQTDESGESDEVLEIEGAELRTLLRFRSDRREPRA